MAPPAYPIFPYPPNPAAQPILQPAQQVVKDPRKEIKQLAREALSKYVLYLPHISKIPGNHKRGFATFIDNLSETDPLYEDIDLIPPSLYPFASSWQIPAMKLLFQEAQSIPWEKGSHTCNTAANRLSVIRQNIGDVTKPPVYNNEHLERAQQAIILLDRFQKEFQQQKILLPQTSVSAGSQQVTLKVLQDILTRCRAAAGVPIRIKPQFPLIPPAQLGTLGDIPTAPAHSQPMFLRPSRANVPTQAPAALPPQKSDPDCLIVETISDEEETSAAAPPPQKRRRRENNPPPPAALDQGNQGSSPEIITID